MGKDSKDKEVDLPYDPNSRSHFVNWEVLKRLSAPRFGSVDNALKAFEDDAPYDKYIEQPPTEDVYYKGKNINEWGEEAIKDELRRRLPIAYLKKHGITPIGKDVEPEPWTPPPTAEIYANNFSFGPATSYQAPWSWQTLGRIFHFSSAPSSRLTATSLRMAFDSTPTDGASRFSMSKHLTYTLRRNRLAVALSTNTLSLTPTPGSPEVSRAVSLTYTPSEDTFLSASYDLMQRRPQLHLALSGQAHKDKAYLLSTLDLKARTYRVRAAASFPGTDWRTPLVDKYGDTYQRPEHGGRHQLWLDQEVALSLKNRCTIGGALDLGLAANLAAHYWLNVLEPGPMAWTLPVWRMIPFGRRLRRALLPEEGAVDQMRFRFTGLQLEGSHTFDSGRLVDGVAVSKRLQAAGSAVRAYYNSSRESVGLEGCVSGLKIAVERGVGEKGRGVRFTIGSDGVAFYA